MFRVMEWPSREDRTEPWSVPWGLVEQWSEQIEVNHSQTMERLHERGGMGANELWLAAHGLRWQRNATPSTAECRAWLRKAAADYMAPYHWPHLLARVLYVPGLMAAVSMREWEAGLDEAWYAEESYCVQERPGRNEWPSWSKAQNKEKVK